MTSLVVAGVQVIVDDRGRIQGDTTGVPVTLVTMPP